MLSLLFFALYGIPSVLACRLPILKYLVRLTAYLCQPGWLDSPVDFDAVPTDGFTILWGHSSREDDFQSTITVEIEHGSADDISTITTTADPTAGSVILPAGFLPAMRPGETSLIQLDIYETIGAYDYGLTVTDVSLFAPTPETATVTVTSSRNVTVSATAEATTRVEGSAVAAPTTLGEVDEDAAAEEEGGENNGSGLSTGVKAGIGVGVSAGVLILVAAGGLYFLRRSKGSSSREEGDPDRPELEASERPISELESTGKIVPAVASPVSDRPLGETYELSG
ncbi:hypothetical protein BJX99DRAFT_265419 [Aspergillus californicus]